MLQVLPNICSGCGESHDKLWPFAKGVCGKCLVKCLTLQEVLEDTCSCCHDEIKKLYSAK